MNNYTIISLGYNCYPSMYNIKTNNTKKDSFFDDIATPMWAIQQLLQNNFDGFFDSSNYNKIKLYDKSNVEFLTNTKYYIRFTNAYQLTKLNSLFSSFKIRKN